MIDPKVSIMIPTYNRASFLQMAVESSLAQDYSNLEVIVSDNASTDNTAEVVEKYRNNPKFKYHRNESNIGLGANWRKLLYGYASGQFGKLLCDDDFLIDKGHVSKAVNLILEYDLTIVLSGSLIKYKEAPVDDSFPREIIFKMPNIVSPDWWINNFGNLQGRTLLYPNLVGSAVFNLTLAKQLNAFNPGIYGLDYELLLKLLLSGNSGYLPGPHWVERYHESDAVTSDFATALEGAHLFCRVYDYGLSLGFPPKKLARFEEKALAPFIRIFLVPKWLREKGGGLLSLLLLYREIKKINPNIFRDVFFRVPTLSEILRYNNITLYYYIRKFYRNIKF